jgi:hypothetical protein
LTWLLNWAVASSVEPGISDATLIVMGWAFAELVAAALEDPADESLDAVALDDALDSAALEDSLDALDSGSALEVAAAGLAALVAGAADVVVLLDAEPLLELQAVATRTVRAPTAARTAVLRRDIAVAPYRAVGVRDCGSWCAPACA